MSQGLVKQIELRSIFWNIEFLKNLCLIGCLKNPSIFSSSCPKKQNKKTLRITKSLNKMFPYIV